MQRREFNCRSFHALGAVVLGSGVPAFAAVAAPLDALSSAQAGQGVQAALRQGVAFAVDQLGRPGGFSENPAVRIPLPGFLNDAAGALRMMGLGARLDELVLAMNRAAEAAVPLARDLLLDAVRSMSLADAKELLAGGDTAVTRFFASKTRAPLFQRFLPIAERATENVGAAAQYNQIAGRVANFGLVKAEDAKLEHYIANKTLDGLYLMIGEEEKKIRQDPMAAGSELLRKVFGNR